MGTHYIPLHPSVALRSWPSVVKKWDPASRWLKKPKLPNEPNLKTAPPAISASREGKPD